MMPAGGFFFAGNVAGKSLSVGKGPHRRVGAVVSGEEAPPRSAFWRSGIPREDGDRDVDAGSGARDRVSPPFSRAGKRKRGYQGQGMFDFEQSETMMFVP